MKYLIFLFVMVLAICVNCNRKIHDDDMNLDKRCLVKYDPGPCRMAINSYYYDTADKKCKQFIYGGCEGSVPFKTLKECQVACKCDSISQ